MFTRCFSVHVEAGDVLASLSVSRSWSSAHVVVGDVLASLSVTRSCSCGYVEVGDVLHLSLSRVVVPVSTSKSGMSLHLSLSRVVVCRLNSVGLGCWALAALFSKYPDAIWAKCSSLACHMLLIFSSCCSLTLGNQHLFSLVGEGVAIFSHVGEVALRLSPWGRRFNLAF